MSMRLEITKGRFQEPYIKYVVTYTESTNSQFSLQYSYIGLSATLKYSVLKIPEYSTDHMP